MTQLRTPKLPAALTPELVAKMRVMYDAGAPLAKIAAELDNGMSRAAVGGTIRRLFGWTRAPISRTKPGPRRGAEYVETMLSLREAGKSSSQIARELGVTRNSVIGQLWRLGVSAKTVAAPAKPVQADPVSAAPPLPPAAVAEAASPIKARIVEEAPPVFSTGLPPLAVSGGEKEPASIADAVAKGSIGKSATPPLASMPAAQSVSPGFRVGASEGAHPPVGAGCEAIAPRVGNRPPREVPPLRLGPLKIADLRECHCRFIAGAVDGADTLYCGEVKSADSSYCSRHAEITGGRGTSSERSAMRYLSYVAHRGLA